VSSEPNKPSSPGLPSPETAASIAEVTFVGPVPPPALLEHYNRISPGFAERVINMAEEEALHRRQQENQSLQAQIAAGERQSEANVAHQREVQRAFARETRLGQWLAFCIGIAAIGAGSYVAAREAQVAGAFIGSGGVVGLVSVFIYGRKQRPGA